MADQKQSKRIHIINKFGPNDNAITGRSAADLGSVLTRAGHDVSFICIRDSYKTLGEMAPPASGHKIVSLRKFSLGSAGLRRLLTALSDGLRLTLSSLVRRSDVVILMTDPPLVNMWSGLFKVFTRRKLFFWTMDLYPDAFAANGMVSRGQTFFRALHRGIYALQPHGIIALGSQQLHYIELQFKRKFRHAILPCGIETVIRDQDPPEWLEAREAGKIKFCYAGNLGEAHDEKFLVALIKAMDPDRHVIYLNLYGAKAAKVLEVVEDLAVVRKIRFLLYSQMHFIDIHIASLSKVWDHVCVPSKAVSAICAGAVLLLNTSETCDNWKMLGNACWLIEQNDQDYAAAVSAFLQSLNPGMIAEKKRTAAVLADQLLAQRELAYQTIIGWLQ